MLMGLDRVKLGIMLMPEDRSTQLDGRGALAAGLLLTALLLVINNVILRAPLADYLLALALIGLGLAVLFIRPAPRQLESATAPDADALPKADAALEDKAQLAAPAEPDDLSITKSAERGG
jgi:hypothetical protein